MRGEMKEETKEEQQGELTWAACLAKYEIMNHSIFLCIKNNL